MKVMRIDHVQLAMPRGEEDAAERFDSGVLGIPRVEKPPHLALRGGCWFEDGDLRLHLGVDEDFRPAKKAHPALVVEDLAVVRARLDAAGFLTSEDQPLEGYDRAYVDDPFGNRIELMEPTS